MGELVRFEMFDDVARITLADPDRLNAISYPMQQQLVARLGEAADVARCVIIRGEGRAFCSGAAVNKMDAWPDDALRRILNPMLTFFRDYEIPLITAVNGPAVGIACSIALMGDIILAAKEAFFLFAFGQVGLVPDGNASYLLPRLIGRPRTAELMLLGERLSAQTALEWGMINRVLPLEELDSEALRIAKTLAIGPASIRQTKRLLWSSLDMDWGTQIEAEAVAQEKAMLTADHHEGVAAFKEKRSPRFTGK